jgi:response regulator NasT
MNRSLRIAVADDEPRMREFYQEILSRMGHQVVCAVPNGRDLVQQCRAMRPNLVIADVKMPDLDGIDAAQQISKDEPIPIILVSAHDDPDLLERAGSCVLAYLVKPVKQQDLQPAITIAIRRFDEFQSLRKEAADLRQALQDRKLIERAKGILMKRNSLDEPAAFLAMQRLARDKNRKLVEIAEMVVTVEEGFGSGKFPL